MLIYVLRSTMESPSQRHISLAIGFSSKSPCGQILDRQQILDRHFTTNHDQNYGSRRSCFLWGSLNPEWDYDLHLEFQLDNYKLNFNAVKNIDVAVRAKS